MATGGSLSGLLASLAASILAAWLPVVQGLAKENSHKVSQLAVAEPVAGKAYQRADGIDAALLAQMMGEEREEAWMLTESCATLVIGPPARGWLVLFLIGRHMFRAVRSFASSRCASRGDFPWFRPIPSHAHISERTRSGLATLPVPSRSSTRQRATGSRGDSRCTD